MVLRHCIPAPRFEAVITQASLSTHVLCPRLFWLLISKADAGLQELHSQDWGTETPLQTGKHILHAVG